LALLLVVGLALPESSLCAQDANASEWPTYGNDPGGMRYSPPAQIKRKNVAKLKVA